MLVRVTSKDLHYVLTRSLNYVAIIYANKALVYFHDIMLAHASTCLFTYLAWDFDVVFTERIGSSC